MYSGYICTPQGALRDILFWMRLGLHLKDQSRANEKKVDKIDIFDVFLAKFAENRQKYEKNSIWHRKVCDTCKYTNFGVLNSFPKLIL